MCGYQRLYLYLSEMEKLRVILQLKYYVCINFKFSSSTAVFDSY